MPAGTTLDSFAGKTYVSVVGFMFTKTKVKGIPIPFHRDFEEVNLRFYVKRRPPGGHANGRDDRRGVVFVKELVPRFAIAWVARVVYRENYVSLTMRHRFHPDGTVEYGFRVGQRWAAVSVVPDGDPRPTTPGPSLRSSSPSTTGATPRRRDGGTQVAQVEHPRGACRAPGARQPGIATCRPSTAPSSSGRSRALPLAFLAEGSPVTVHGGIRIAR